MRRVWGKALVLSILLFLSSGFCAAQKLPTLTSLEQVVALSNAEAAKALPVKFEGTITFLELQDGGMFIEQNAHGVYLSFTKDIGLQPGDHVEVTGITMASFRPEVSASDVRFLAHGTLPVPQPAKFEDLIQSKWDSRYVVISGHVLAAAMDQEMPHPGIRIQMKVPQGVVAGRIARPGNLETADLLDADIQLTGVAGGEFDSRMQMAGVWIDVYSAADVVIKHRPETNSWNLTTVPMDQVIYAYRNGSDSQRVKIAGTLTYFEPGALAVVERGGLGVLVETGSTLPLHAGEEVEATGFPEVVDENVRIGYGLLRSLAQNGRVQAQKINWTNAPAGQYAYNLIEMEAGVVAVVPDSRVDLFILRSEGHLFSATLRHSSSDASRASQSLQMPTVGSRVRVTGVCFMDAGNHWHDRLWFDVRMRSLDDIVVIQQPSWWTVKRLAYVTMLLSAVILVAVIWAGLLDRRLRTQTAVLARQSKEEAIRERRLVRQELQRSNILELISSSEPLPEVLREIQSMVSSRLYGASCWFELRPAAGGTTEPERPTDPAVVFQELFSPEGTSFGFLLATQMLRIATEADISAAMGAGARLAELAIDTRRLYSDLRHRSEHDLLTDIPNRFSMERHLERLLLAASRDEGIFGLIYLDLDHFKQVNDRYGHRTGDLYLQEATRRMKLQLRNGDVLARIGGDEFIALVPILRNRIDAEEIAIRLEHCFDEPFELEGRQLSASASLGLAVYPEDGTTKEELQRSADATMYAHKATKRRQERLDAAMQRVWSEDLTP